MSAQQNQTVLARYTLLNDNNEPQDGYFIDMFQWPSAESNTGSAVYIDADGTRDLLQFHLDLARQVLRTFHVRAPKHVFDVKPIIKEGEVVELQMDLGDNDVATFVLHPEDYADTSFETNKIPLLQMEAVSF